MPSSAGPRSADGGSGKQSSRSSAIEIPLTSATTSQCCGCNCRCCKDCIWRKATSWDESNREEYGGEGTAVPVDTLMVKAPSYATSSSAGSVPDSSIAPIAVAPRMLRSGRSEQERRRQGPFASSPNGHMMQKWLEDIDDHPFRYFVSPSPASSAVLEPEDHPGFFGELDLGISMRNNVGSNEQSMMSSLGSSHRAPSISVSDAVFGAGTAFGPRSGMGQQHSFIKLN